MDFCFFEITIVYLDGVQILTWEILHNCMLNCMKFQSVAICFYPLKIKLENIEKNFETMYMKRSIIWSINLCINH